MRQLRRVHQREHPPHLRRSPYVHGLVGACGAMARRRPPPRLDSLHWPVRCVSCDRLPAVRNCRVSCTCAFPASPRPRDLVRPVPSLFYLSLGSPTVYATTPRTLPPGSPRGAFPAALLARFSHPVGRPGLSTTFIPRDPRVRLRGGPLGIWGLPDDGRVVGTGRGLAGTVLLAPACLPVYLQPRFGWAPSCNRWLLHSAASARPHGAGFRGRR